MKLCLVGEHSEVLERLVHDLQTAAIAVDCWIEWPYSGPGSHLPSNILHAEYILLLYTQETLLRSCKGGSMLRKLLGEHSRFSLYRLKKIILVPETTNEQIPDVFYETFPRLKHVPCAEEATAKAIQKVLLTTFFQGIQGTVVEKTLRSLEMTFEFPKTALPDSLPEGTQPKSVSAPAVQPKKTQTTAPLFISYSSKDRDTVDALRDLLLTNGIPCWMAPYDIPPGARYLNVIADAIDGCGGLLVAVSANSQASEQVEREANLLISDFPEKPVYALIIDGQPLRGWMRLLLQNRQIEQAAEITGSDPGLIRLIEALKRVFT